MSDAQPERTAPTDLVALDPDHPGFRDRAYRDRRNAIAQLALQHVSGAPVPEVVYTEDEHEVWREVWRRLQPLHESSVCRELWELQEELALGRRRVPQLSEINPALHDAGGFRMEPVAGLVSARTFLSWLGRGVFLSTQYIRHPSRPLYTPEPDVVHELVGHAASLTHPRIAAVSRELGRMAQHADDRQILRLERIYWYTLEFGLVEEDGEARAFGAGLLSSSGELADFGRADLRDWDLERIARTDYDPTGFQPQLFVAPSFRRLLDDVTEFCRHTR